MEIEYYVSPCYKNKKDALKEIKRLKKKGYKVRFREFKSQELDICYRIIGEREKRKGVK